MQNELQRIWMQTPHSAVLVTHQIREAVYLADRVIVMSGRPGQITEIMPINFARPRSLLTVQDPRFQALEIQIWKMLQTQLTQQDASIHASVVNL
jgi:NitT/TauT family transport system ATP-binding protein